MPENRPRTPARLRTGAGAELPLLITLDTAAEYLGCARSTAHEWATRAEADGAIPGLRVIAPGVRRVVATELLGALGRAVRVRRRRCSGAPVSGGADRDDDLQSG